jgi:GNAT superfamily N-acetyltransferase
MIIKVASDQDLAYLSQRDYHISPVMLKRKLEAGEILVAYEQQTPVGYLRFNYFWDNTPFMNLLFLEENVRRKGLGKQLVQHWEKMMQKNGYTRVMTSSLASEEGQFFYRKLGYKDAGALLLENEALEIIFIKVL